MHRKSLKVADNYFRIYLFKRFKSNFLIFNLNDRMNRMDRKEIVEGCMKNALYSMLHTLLNNG